MRRSHHRGTFGPDRCRRTGLTIEGMTALLPERRDLALLAPEAGLADTVRWAVGHAVLAPSLLNSQPWLFRADLDDLTGDGRLELYLDRRRVLVHLDPTGREAVLACGAALLSLRLALRAAGVGSTLRLTPDGAAPDLLAELVLHGTVREHADELVLRTAMTARATCRTPFLDTPVTPEVLDHLVAEGAYEGALVAVLDSDQTATVLRAAKASAQPGQLVVLGSSDDQRGAVVRAGSGLQRLLLGATARGLAARFVDEVMRDDATRSVVGRAAQLDCPQVLLRLGFPVAGALAGVTRRRPVDEVLHLVTSRKIVTVR